MIGCALDTWRLTGRQFPQTTWQTDPRMKQVKADGHVFRILDAGDATSGTPVLFAADAPVVLEHYAPVLNQLVPDRRAVAMELPGFGFSTPAPGYRFTLAHQVAALTSLLDAMEVPKATLAFTCVNALVALAFAARHPDRVDRLVLSQIPSAEQFAQWAARIDMRVLGRSVLGTPLVGQALMWAAPAFIADRWFHAALGPKADHPTLMAQARQVYAHGGAFCLAALNQALAGVSFQDVGVSPVPTTVVWGTADRTHRKTDKTSSGVWHPDANIQLWDDAGHCPDLECPAAFAALLL